MKDITPPEDRGHCSGCKYWTRVEDISSECFLVLARGNCEYWNSLEYGFNTCYRFVRKKSDRSSSDRF